MPHHTGIGQQTETGCLVHHLCIIARLERALGGKTEGPGQLGAPGAPIELALHLGAQRFVLTIA
jgi:hypothetical protein